MILTETIDRIKDIIQCYLFDANDAYTRATIRNDVRPYLEDLLDRGLIFDCNMICDASNNRNHSDKLILDIYYRDESPIGHMRFTADKYGIHYENRAESPLDIIDKAQTRPG